MFIKPTEAQPNIVDPASTLIPSPTVMTSMSASSAM